MAEHHQIATTPETMVRGYLDASLPPILTVQSGDTVGLTAWGAASENTLPADRSIVAPGHIEAIQKLGRGPTSHILVGPIYVDDAERGDVLQIDILEISLQDDWGFVAILPGRGTLPDDFADPVIIHPVIDRERAIAQLPWGADLPLEPFFGLLAVAPPLESGRCSSLPPGRFGGNMDNKLLRPGATLYVPILNDGGRFFAGDGHAVQGDGEVCLTALETTLAGRFRLTTRKDLDYVWPFAETPDQIISIGLDEDLDEAARRAVSEMIAHICRRTNLTKEDAYMLCSLAGDLHVTQTVDGVKGCHMVLDKRHLG